MRSKPGDIGNGGWIFALVLIFFSTGATCLRRPSISEFQPPVQFQEAPSAEQLAEVINRSRGIQQLESNALSISIPNEGQMSTNLSWQRHRNFRVQGSKLGFVGLDLGSNDQSFWMALKSGPNPVLFYANHQEFEQQNLQQTASRQFLPVSPLWLVEAIGIVEFDPYSLVSGPRTRADRLVELETAVPTAAGTYQRTLVVHPQYGYVTQTFLRDPTGRLLASSVMSDHQHFPSVQYSLPKKAQIQLLPAGAPPMDLTIYVGNYAINSEHTIDPSRFQMPDTRGYQVIDLVRLNQMDQGAVTLPGVQPPMVPNVSYRGLDAPTLFR